MRPIGLSQAIKLHAQSIQLTARLRDRLRSAYRDHDAKVIERLGRLQIKAEARQQRRAALLPLEGNLVQETFL